MSNEALTAVAKASISPSGRKFVAMALADYADEAWTCFPSIEFLARYTSQGARSVQRHLDDLEADGIITRSRPRKPDGTLAGYRYTLHRDKLPVAATIIEKPIDHTPNRPVAKSASGQIVQEPPAKLATHNPQDYPSSSLRSEARAREPDEFELFWQEYPNKQGKKPARASFAKARKVAELDSILEGLRRYIASKPPDRQWLNPATFLNHERWTDEPSVAIAPAARAGPAANPMIDVLDTLIDRMESADGRSSGQSQGSPQIAPPIPGSTQRH